MDPALSTILARRVVLVQVFTSSTRTPVADLSGLRGGWFGRWTDGVVAMRGDCIAFASHWQLHNYRVLTESGPLWVVLGDSTAQGLGAPDPRGGYVGQALHQLRRRSGQHWRVLNLSASGALVRDVLGNQLPQLPVAPDLVTCGIGANDVDDRIVWAIDVDRHHAIECPLVQEANRIGVAN